MKIRKIKKADGRLVVEVTVGTSERVPCIREIQAIIKQYKQRTGLRT